MHVGDYLTTPGPQSQCRLAAVRPVWYRSRMFCAALKRQLPPPPYHPVRRRMHLPAT